MKELCGIPNPHSRYQIGRPNLIARKTDHFLLRSRKIPSNPRADLGPATAVRLPGRRPDLFSFPLRRPWSYIN